jgi:hypothetical protein
MHHPPHTQRHEIQLPKLLLQLLEEIHNRPRRSVRAPLALLTVQEELVRAFVDRCAGEVGADSLRAPVLLYCAEVCV